MGNCFIDEKCIDRISLGIENGFKLLSAFNENSTPVLKVINLSRSVSLKKIDYMNLMRILFTYFRNSLKFIDLNSSDLDDE